MASTILSVACAAVLLTAASTAARAGDVDIAANCAALLQPTEVSHFNSTAATYAYWLAVQSKHSSDNSFNIGAMIPVEGVPVSLNGDGSFKSNDDYGKNTGINWTSETKDFLLARYIPTSASTAFNECARIVAQDRKTNDVYFSIDSISDNTIYLTMKVTDGASEDEKRHIIIEPVNARIINRVSDYVGFTNSARPITLQWINPTKSFSISAHLENTHNLPLGQPGAVKSSPIWSEVPIQNLRSNPSVSRTTCGGDGNRGRIYGNTVEQRAASNQVFNTSTVQVVNRQDVIFHSHKDVVASEKDFAFDVLTPTLIQGRAYCAEWANERPGYVAGFVVSGTQFNPPSVTPSQLASKVALQSRVVIGLKAP